MVRRCDENTLYTCITFSEINIKYYIEKLHKQSLKKITDYSLPGSRKTSEKISAWKYIVASTSEQIQVQGECYPELCSFTEAETISQVVQWDIPRCDIPVMTLVSTENTLSKGSFLGSGWQSHVSKSAS